MQAKFFPYITAAEVLLDTLDQFSHSYYCKLIFPKTIIYFIFLQVSMEEAEEGSQVSMVQPRSRWAWGRVAGVLR